MCGLIDAGDLTDGLGPDGPVIGSHDLNAIRCHRVCPTLWMPPQDIYIYNIYICMVPPQKNTLLKKGEVGGTNKSESAMCMWHLIKMLNEHPPASDQIPPHKNKGQLHLRSVNL